MVATPNIPFLITADAEERLQQLGMQHELMVMLAHAKQTVPSLRAIEVRPYFDEDGTMLVVTAHKDPPDTEDDPAQAEFYSWLEEAFPSEINRWFLFEVDYRDSNAIDLLP